MVISITQKKETTARLVLTVNKLRKRAREHEGMVDIMNNYVKRHKPEWSYIAPIGLTPFQAFLWKKYECKIHNTMQQYGANGITSSVGHLPLFDSLSVMFKVVNDTYTKHIQTHR